MTCNNKDRILQLYGDLTGDYVSSFPDIDWNDPMFQIPQELLDKILEDHNPVDINQVTTKEFDGSGDFDVLMYSTSAHLKEEYKNKRITGADYAKAWVSMFESTMAQAVGFTLAKDEAKWKAIQARLEAIQAITNLKLAQAQIAALKQEEGLKKAQYGLVKAQIVTEELNQCRIREETANVVTQRDQILEQTRQIKYITDTQLPAQVANTNSDTAIKEYQLDNILPKEASNLTKQGNLLDSQKSNVDANTLHEGSKKLSTEANTLLVGQQRINLEAEALNIPKQGNLIDAQKDQVDAQTENIESDTAIKEYQLDNILPKEAANLTKQGVILDKQAANIEAETALTSSNKSKVDYEVSDVLPAQIANTEAQTSLVTSQKTQTDYTTSSVLPAQVTNQEKQTALLDYDLTKLKPQELVIRTNEALLKKYEYEHIIPVELGIKQAQLDIQEEELNIKKYELLNKLPAEVVLLTAQSGLTNAQATHESVKKDLTTQQKTNLAAEALNIPKQGKVLDAQEGLIKEQTESERANTLDTRKDGAAIKGSVGAQKNLYGTQAIAYRDDTRIKAGKLWADAWAVRYTISESEEVPSTFSDLTVNNTLEDIKLKFGT